MFAARYFAPRYFAPRYWAKAGEDPSGVYYGTVFQSAVISGVR